MSVKEVYAVKHKDESVRMASRSGGIFTALSDIVLNAGGSVYGCALDESFHAVHIRAIKKSDRDRMRGSKYVQSCLGNCFSLCAQDLKNGLSVLFSGTPCQIYGLLCFLDTKGISTNNLLTVDIICHGIASPKAWQMFLTGTTKSEKINSVDFRDKKQFGWDTRKTTITTDINNLSTNDYSDLYYKDILSPKNCFSCHFKKTKRFSDITIGDYWHIDELNPSFNDNKGVSLVIVNSEKGEKYFDSCKNDIIYEKHPLVFSMQKALSENYQEPKNRKEFFIDLDVLTFDELHNKYMQPIKKPVQKLSIKQKIIRRLFYYAEKVIMFGK